MPTMRQDERERASGRGLIFAATTRPASVRHRLPHQLCLRIPYNRDVCVDQNNNAWTKNLRIASASHDLSTYDEGDTSSASEDSMASSYTSPAVGAKIAAVASAPVTTYNKRAAEPSPSFTLPPSQRSRTTALPLPRKQGGWLPVSGGTFETGISGSSAPSSTTVAAAAAHQQQQQQQRQLPRLAALETLLSSHTQQQRKQQEHHHEHQQQLQQPHQRFQACQEEYPIGAHHATTKVPMQRSNDPPMQLPPLSSQPTQTKAVATSSAAPSSSSSTAGLSRSSSSSPSCSPSRRRSPPPCNNIHHNDGRYQLPLPVCMQGTGAGVGTSFSGGSVNQPQHHQRWIAGARTTDGGGAGGGELRRQVPRIDALSSSSSGNNCNNGTNTSRQHQQQEQHQQVWETSRGWPKPAGERMGGGFAQTTAAAVSPPFSSAGAPVGYDLGMEEERGSSNWPRQQAGAGASWSHQQQSQVRRNSLVFLMLR